MRLTLQDHIDNNNARYRSMAGHHPGDDDPFGRFPTVREHRVHLRELNSRHKRQIYFNQKMAEANKRTSSKQFVLDQLMVHYPIQWKAYHNILNKKS